MGTAVTTATEQRSLRFGVIGLVGVLLLAAFALAPPAMPARAAANVVTDCGNDPAVSDTLPYAVVNAVANDTITFAQDCNGATAPNNTITLTAPLIPTVNVTIDATAPAHIVTISGNNAAQLFAVNNVTLALRGLTLTGGNNSTGGAVGIASGGMANTSGCTFTVNSGGGLMNPNPQLGVKPNTTARQGATVAPQPTRKADGAGAGVLPQAAGPTPEPTATPGAQPSRH